MNAKPTTQSNDMFDGRRSLGSVLRAPFRVAHYRAALTAFRAYVDPITELRHYIFSSGKYPRRVGVRTPIGVLSPTLFSPHDLRTVNEVFCRRDYPCSENDKVIVDFGSNIGISALYFLSRSDDSFCYLFEPLPSNVARLRENLGAYTGRIEVNEFAVGLQEGEVAFAYESTGRYGGIGLKSQTYLNVRCRRATDILTGILQRHAFIDILKVDIESLEKEILNSIPEAQLRRIRKIYVEQMYERNPFPENLFKFRQTLSVAQFLLNR